jgi:hypothetical protein
MRAHPSGLLVAGWLASLLLFLLPAPAVGMVDVHFFWSANCPYCHEMAATLEEIREGEPYMTVHSYEVTRSEGDAALYSRVAEGFGLPPAVPLVIIGDAMLVGHSPGSQAQLRGMVAACRTGPCPDAIAPFRTGAASRLPEAAPRQWVPERIRVPLFGNVETAALSLPLLTIVMAAIDGFNPCAMWVLVFLLGLLIGIPDRRRMWILAATFLAATAALYFLVLAAWLNILLLLGALAWLRIAIGGLALLAGGIYLREGLRREENCPVTRPERRRRIFEGLRRLVKQPHLGAAMAGIALLAVAVNLVELLCSAGIPAVYTGILARADLPPLGHYLYLALYVLVFLADDTIIVVAAMTTLRLTGMDRGYARWVRLAGGALMLVLGLALIFRPDWLSFALY